MTFNYCTKCSSYFETEDKSQQLCWECYAPGEKKMKVVLEGWAVLTADVEGEHQVTGIETYVPIGEGIFGIGGYDPEGAEVIIPFLFTSEAQAQEYRSRSNDPTRRVEYMIITLTLEE